MKLLPILSLLALSVGSARALEITYFGVAAQQMPAATARASVSLPLFDVSRPDIPDNAVLLSVWIAFETTANAWTSFFNPSSSIGDFRGVIGVNTRFQIANTPSQAQTFTASEPFVTPLVATGNNAAVSFSQAFSGSRSVTGAGLSGYIAGNSALTGVYMDVESTNSTFYSGPTGSFSFGDTRATLSASVTYTYGVPDGGWTLALLAPAMLGLVSLRRLWSRRSGCQL